MPERKSNYRERKCSHENQKTVTAQINVPKELNLLYIQREKGGGRRKEKERRRGREHAGKRKEAVIISQASKITMWLHRDGGGDRFWEMESERHRERNEIREMREWYLALRCLVILLHQLGSDVFFPICGCQPADWGWKRIPRGEQNMK